MYKYDKNYFFDQVNVNLSANIVLLVANDGTLKMWDESKYV